MARSVFGTIFGRKARFCSEACRDGFRSDRQHDLIYPSYDVDGEIMNVESASMIAHFCAYCQTDIERYTRK